MHGMTKSEPIVEVKAPEKPGKYEYLFYVIDGLRASESVKVTINVVDDEPKPDAEQ